MKATDFDFPLPEELIALKPASPRDTCRLMLLQRDGNIEHKRFSDLPDYLEKGDMLLLNNTRVFPARVICKKKTGGKIEVLLVREIEPDTWEILSRERYTGKVSISDELSGEIFEGKLIRLELIAQDTMSARNVMQAVWSAGYMPLPPYIKRRPGESDREWYQTVYAERTGSIAAPTAGLHFTGELLEGIEKRGVIIRTLTLHVGTGTFKPIKAGIFADHTMDAEHFEMDTALIEAIKEVKSSGRRVISVGTTTTRAIEGFVSGHWKGNSSGKSNFPLPPFTKVGYKNGSIKGSTDIFIYPGYEFKAVDSLITNFHLPKSTPLLLTSALCGKKRLMDAYRTAVSLEYSFFSYGDAMLIL